MQERVDTAPITDRETLPCPFCGISVNVHDDGQVSHDLTDNCPLDGVFMALDDWQLRQGGYQRVNIRDLVTMLNVDAKGCDCSAWDESECICGAWDGDNTITIDDLTRIALGLDKPVNDA